ncbi:MAG: hypothetical protein ACOYT4_03115 [Nanoarchaeota archaeon]
MRKTLDKIILSGFVLMCLNYGNVREAYCARLEGLNRDVTLSWNREPGMSYNIYYYNSITFEKFKEEVEEGINIPIDVCANDVCHDGECEYEVKNLDANIRYNFTLRALDECGRESDFSNVVTLEEGRICYPCESETNEQSYYDPNRFSSHPTPNSNESSKENSQSGCFISLIK